MMATAAERLEALEILDGFPAEQPFLDVMLDDAWEAFAGDFLDSYEELEGTEHEHNAEQFFHMWFMLDEEIEEGRRPVDLLLAMNNEMSAGARGYLERLAETSVDLYEVAEVVAGESLLLRHVLEGGTIEVNERNASRMVEPYTLLVARIIHDGVSGGPEMERGVLQIPRAMRETVVEQIAVMRAELIADGVSRAAIDRELAPVLFQAWLSCFNRPKPKLANTDGEPLLYTKLVFRIIDHDRLVERLQAAADIEANEEGEYEWSGENQRGEVVSLGRLEVKSERLFVRVNSLQRAERARTLIEELAGGSVVYRVSVQEDVEKKLEKERDAATAPMSLESEEVEAALLEHLSRHYRKWLDEEIPMFDGLTPRAAARSPSLRPKVVEALKDLEHMYYRALRAGAPAFDPFWMWGALGLDDHPSAPKARKLPPPLAHESMGRLVAGFTEIVRSMTKSLRKRSDCDHTRAFSDQELSDHLEMQRFARRVGRSALDAGASPEVAAFDADLACFLAGCAINQELHHKKTFWVGHGLSVMFDQTDADVPGEILRLPFAAFALVFTDRHFLGIAERMLAIEERESTLTGQAIRIATVYVREEPADGRRAVRVTFAFDGLGGDWPYILSRVIPIDSASTVKEIVRAHLPKLSEDDRTLTSERLARLVNLVMNAILYTTCAEVRMEVLGEPAKRKRKRSKKLPVHTSNKVFHLPGHIDIQNIENLTAVARAPSGRQILHRFMVRGHWRRPNPSWKDQRMRWIEPYWKGPEMASIIERAYRLKPGDVLDLDGAEVHRDEL